VGGDKPGVCQKIAAQSELRKLSKEDGEYSLSSGEQLVYKVVWEMLQRLPALVGLGAGVGVGVTIQTWSVGDPMPCNTSSAYLRSMQHSYATHT
jgi:hypothetical protein